MASITARVFDQPRLIYSLAMVSFWHVAAYAGVMGHLVLLLTAAPREYGYGWTGGEAIRMYGMFTGSVHVTPLIGGWIADAFLGKRRGAVWGMWLQTWPIFVLAGVGLLPAMVGAFYGAPVHAVLSDADVPIARMALGAAEAARLEQAAATHAGGGDVAALLATANWTYGLMTLGFYASLVVFALGYALQTPTLAAMVGLVYDRTDGDRASGYTLMFMAAMLGFIVGGVLSGSIMSNWGWPAGLASTAIMMAISAIQLQCTQLPRSREATSTDDESNAGNSEADATATDQGSAMVALMSLTRPEKRRVTAICALCLGYFVFIAAFEQWAGSFSLYVQNTSERVIAGFEIPTLWIHSAQALFVILVGPVMLAVWSQLERRGVHLTPPTKMAIGLGLTSIAFIVMAVPLPRAGGSLAVKTSLFWPLAFYWVITFGQMAVLPTCQAFVAQEAPRRLLSTMMGAFMLFGGVGIWSSGQIGGLSESFGILAVYIGIVVGTAVAAVGMLAIKPWLMGLLADRDEAGATAG